MSQLFMSPTITTLALLICILCIGVFSYYLISAKDSSQQVAPTYCITLSEPPTVQLLHRDTVENVAVEIYGHPVACFYTDNPSVYTDHLQYTLRIINTSSAPTRVTLSGGEASHLVFGIKNYTDHTTQRTIDMPYNPPINPTNAQEYETTIAPGESITYNTKALMNVDFFERLASPASTYQSTGTLYVNFILADTQTTYSKDFEVEQTISISPGTTPY